MFRQAVELEPCRPNTRVLYCRAATEQLHLPATNGFHSPEPGSRVSCFVRSEIKWVFLKDIKVTLAVFGDNTQCKNKLCVT